MSRHAVLSSRRLLLLATVVLIGLILGACSDAIQSEVRPFSEVQETEFVFEADPTNPDRGIFRVTTTEPMICAIVWGETEALGNMNNSLAMNGTGIIDHDVFLPGAVPGETYFFKVQGSTADGTLYESELATFTIPEPEEAPDDGDGDTADLGPNLALEATVADVSSEFGDSWLASNAIDGDGSTEWATTGDGDDAVITLDLGSEREIRAVELVTRSMADGTSVITDYSVTFDGGEPIGPFASGSLADPNPIPVTQSARMVRFEAASTTGGNTGAVEVRVYGPADG